MTTPLAVSLVLVLAGCSGQAANQATQPAVTSTGSSAPVTTPAVTTPAVTSTVAVDRTAAVCKLVDSAMYTHLLSQGAAIGRYKDDDAQLRTAFAGIYKDFAVRLGLFGKQAEAALRTALADWAAATAEIGDHIATRRPKRGLVVDFGPAEARAKTARKAAETVCGHPLPSYK
ncbi:hypothetical protein [Kibdelosporangium phytohabitans]|nr:hypothetical protein [Kibdelosporangium phytohabitans]MBE1467846.1 hypothetical protein [Kibdelosporangium phytohabitans]